MDVNKPVEDTVAESEALIASITALRRERDSGLEALGLDDAKMQALRDQATPELEAEIEAACQKEQESLQDAINEELTRLSFQQPGKARPKKLRNLV